LLLKGARGMLAQRPYYADRCPTKPKKKVKFHYPPVPVGAALATKPIKDREYNNNTSDGKWDMVMKKPQNITDMRPFQILVFPKSITN